MSFSRTLQQKLEPIWTKNHSHPFVTGMGDGTLDKEAFRYFMIQDYLYLKEYSRLFAMGTMKARTLKTMGEFADLLRSTLNEEMQLHREYSAKLNITEEELEQAEAAPVTLAYTRYMLHEGQSGGLAELTAALLPCMWSYAEIGRDLNRIPGAAEHELYGEWIRMYSDPGFQELADWCIALLDELAEGKPQHELDKLEEIFLTTTKFEYLFWDMAYHHKTWPV